MNDTHTIGHPANWPVRYLCDCKKQGKPITIHEGFAHDISSDAMRIRSEHHICSGKEIALLLKIPPLAQGGEHALVKLFGKSVITIAHGGAFLTDIKFSRFEKDGQEMLNRHLSLCFGNPLYSNMPGSA